MMQATYSFEDNKLRLYSVERLDPETYAKVKEAGFSWAPKQQLFVAPMWTPYREKVLLDLVEEIENEDVTLEQRAAERAERFEQYSKNRAQDSERYADQADSMSEAFTMGQPILVGHHSEKKARKLAQKIENSMRASIKFYEQSNYWASRSKDVLYHAARKERPDVRIRRIKKLEAEKRSHDKEISKSQDFIKLWTSSTLTAANAVTLAGYDRVRLKMENLPPLYPGHDGFFSLWDLLNGNKVELAEILPRIVACHEKSIRHETKWSEHLQRRIDYERAMLEASGHTMPDFKAIAAAKRSKTTALPIVNCPGDGVVEITKEKWAKIHADYKGVRKSKCGKYRYRIAMERSLGLDSWGLTQVFITDQKRVDIPEVAP